MVFLRRLKRIISMPNIPWPGFTAGDGEWNKMIYGHSLYTGVRQNQGNPYASLELAKMYRDGLGTKQDPKLAERRFQDCVFRLRDIGRKEP